MPNKLRPVIITIVTLVWGANFAAPIFVKDYSPPAELNVAFMAILGILTTRAAGNRPDDDPKEQS